VLVNLSQPSGLHTPKGKLLFHLGSSSGEFYSDNLSKETNKSKYEILFRQKGRLQSDARRRYSVRELSVEVDSGETGDEMIQIVTEVKTASPMSNNTLTSTQGT
jgi:hypothetical protein